VRVGSMGNCSGVGVCLFNYLGANYINYEQNSLIFSSVAGSFANWTNGPFFSGPGGVDIILSQQLVTTNSSATLSGGVFTGNGGGLTNLNASSITSGTLTGNGSHLTNLNAANVVISTLGLTTNSTFAFVGCTTDTFAGYGTNPFTLTLNSTLIIPNDPLAPTAPYVLNYGTLANPLFILSAQQQTDTPRGSGIVGFWESTDMTNWYIAGSNDLGYDNQWSPKLFLDATNGLHYTVALGTNEPQMAYIVDLTNLNNLSQWSNVRELVNCTNVEGSCDGGGLMYYDKNTLAYYFYSTTDGGGTKNFIYTNSSLSSTGWVQVGNVVSGSGPCLFNYLGTNYLMYTFEGDIFASVDGSLTNWTMTDVPELDLGGEEGNMLSYPLLETNIISTPIVSGGVFTGNGGGLTNIQASAIVGSVPVNLTNLANIFVGTFIGNGAGLTNIIFCGPTNATPPADPVTIKAWANFTNASGGVFKLPLYQ